MLINDDDKKFVNKYFSGLKFVENKKELYLTGTLKFIVKFDKKNKEYFLFKKNINNSFFTISDCYDIEINISAKNVYREVRETKNRILNVARKKGIKNPADLHLNPDTHVCVAGYLDEIVDISLTDFLCKIIIPFFYDQSFFEKNNYWPRKGFSHGVLGMLENYYRINFYKYSKIEKIEFTKKCVDLINFILFINNRQFTNITISNYQWNYIKKFIMDKKINKKIPCIESSIKFNECHHEAFKGLIKLRKYISRFDLKSILNL
jgi:hypothetical protein